MTTDTTTPPAPEVSSALGRGSLFRSELLRIRRRRLIQVLLGVGLVAYLAIIGVLATQFGKPSAADLASAQEQVDAQLESNREYYETCIADPEEYGAGSSADQEEVRAVCGPEPTVSDAELEWFLERPPFQLEVMGPDGVSGVALGTAAVLFVIGATAIGADWSSRTLVSLLSWETRRLRVMAAKVSALTVLTVLVAVAAQALWVLAAIVLARTRGNGDVPAGFWGDLLLQQMRGVLVVLAAALVGWGVANLTRSTAAAFGVGFVYFAVLEAAIQLGSGEARQWLVSTSSLALIQKGGVEIYIYDQVYDAAQGGLVDQTRIIEVGNLQGGLTLAAYTAAILLVGLWLFRRRDLN